MIFQAVSRSLANLLAPQSRWLLLKSMGLAALFLLATFLLLHQGFVLFVGPWLDSLGAGLPEWLAWLTGLILILSNLGIAVALVLLMAPVTTLVAGLFLDDIAEAIERRDYPANPPGVAMPLGPSILSAIRFSLVVLAANILALILYFIPGVNLVAFFLINGYLIGREYFEFAAMRFMPPEQARALRAANNGTVILGGCLAALMLAIPFVNLATPIFAAGLMVHLVAKIRTGRMAAA